MFKSKLDILYVIDNNLDIVGGSEKSTKILLDELNDTYSLGIIQPGKSTNESNLFEVFSILNNMRVKNIVKNPYKLLLYLLEIRKIINRISPKIVHTQSQFSFFAVSFLIKIRLLNKNFKFFHTDRGLYTRYSNLIKIIFYKTLPQLDVFITTTNYNHMLWKNVLDKKKINLHTMVIENTAGKKFETINLDLKKNSTTLAIGFVGRYDEQKNWPLAIEIVDKTRKIIGENLIVYMAVGCLDERSYIKTNEMFDLMKRKLGKNFIGMVNADSNQIEDLYYNTDIFILTSKPNTESFGRTLIEAMSRKNILLSTYAGGPSEVINNNKNICNSSDEFIRRILYYYNNKEAAEIEKCNNLNRFNRNYSLKNNIKKHTYIYDLYLKK